MDSSSDTEAANDGTYEYDTEEDMINALEGNELCWGTLGLFPEKAACLLAQAAKNGWKDAVTLMLEDQEYFDVDVVAMGLDTSLDTDHMTPLIAAIKWGQVDMVRMLVNKFNADVQDLCRHKNSHHWCNCKLCPLETAVECENVEMINILKAKGAKYSQL